MFNKKIKKNSETNNSGYFDQTTELSKRNSFSRREVGLSHPDTNSFIKLNDRGEIEIFVGEELGMVISPSTRSISLFADVIKFVTKEDYGLRWNGNSFNYAADVYSEPALVETNQKEINSGFNSAGIFLDSIDGIDLIEKDRNITTILGDFSFRSKMTSLEESPIINRYTNVSQEDIDLLVKYAEENPVEKVEYMKKLLESGFNFSQAKEKTERDKG